MRTLWIGVAVWCVIGPGHLPGQENSFTVASLVEKSDLKRGLCAVTGAGKSLPLSLASESRWLIHVRLSSPESVASLRRDAEEAGYGIDRLAVEHGPEDVFPYADNTVDIAVCGPGAGSLAIDELLRALRPEGAAFVRVESESDFQSRREDLEMDSLEFLDMDGALWAYFRKPVPSGSDDWSHWEKAPDNNPVSNDQLIKAPYMTQFMAKPYYIGMPAVTTVAGGRSFLAMGHIAHHPREWEMLNRLIARNGYNGTILWEREFPEGYLVHRSAFVATKDTFYMIDGDHVLKLDAKTGVEQGEIRIPDFEGDWKWIAMQGGILYALAGEPDKGGAEFVKGKRALGGWSWADLSSGYYGKRIPHGFGDVIAAYDTGKDEVLWMHREDSLIDSRGLAISGDDFYLYCPDRHLRALNRESGEIRWTNNSEVDLGLIEEPGKGLSSTPGWRTQSIIVATPDALVVQGQTRMNVLGFSTEDGSMQWHKPKFTNNPNAIYVDGKVILAVGPKGSHVVIDPVNGTVEDDLGFYKRACTRLTASTDSFFTRGEGMQRVDRESLEVTVDGAVRPACNDGVIPANGLLYLGPWACDCNLSLIGNVARCSAGDFDFSRKPGPDQLFVGKRSATIGETEISEKDWPTYRSNNERSSGSSASIPGRISRKWWMQPDRTRIPTESTAVGALIFTGGEDGKARAFAADTGEEVWAFQTGGILKYPPTVAEGRIYFGSGDGHAYCLEAATGQLLWRFRASPVERHLMVYDYVSSTWPVNTGVLVENGVAYFAAGIVDHDGTYVYALDAKSGEIKWANTTSGHLNEELRKGVSAQGNLSILDDVLLLAGGNVVSPAAFSLENGQSLDTPREGGHPQNNGGKFIGALGENIIQGGRILYSSPQNVSTKGAFDLWSADRRRQTLNYGGIPPAWNDSLLVVANFKFGKVTALGLDTLERKIREGFEDSANNRNRFGNNVVQKMTARAEEEWQAAFGDSQGFEPLSLALAKNAVVAVARYQDIRRSVPQWFLTAMNPGNGAQLFQEELPAEPLPGGLMITRSGDVVVTLLDGGLVCYGE